jgi:hypothetical protein
MILEARLPHHEFAAADAREIPSSIIDGDAVLEPRDDDHAERTTALRRREARVWPYVAFAAAEVGIALVEHTDHAVRNTVHVYRPAHRGVVAAEMVDGEAMRHDRYGRGARGVVRRTESPPDNRCHA